MKLNFELVCAGNIKVEKIQYCPKGIMYHFRQLGMHQKFAPDNNGSDCAIRNIKFDSYRVKQKISRQLKSPEGADAIPILGSTIDNPIKSGQNVLNALTLIAQLKTE